MKLAFYSNILDKYSYVKFHETLSSGSRDFLRKYGRRAEIMKLRVAFGKFANTRKKKK